MFCFHRVLNEEVLGFRLMIRQKKQWEDLLMLIHIFLRFYRLNF